MILDHLMNQRQTKLDGSSGASTSVGTRNLMIHPPHVKDSGVMWNPRHKNKTRQTLE